MIDFIIVGQGLTANVLMHTFHTHGLSFITIGHTGLSTCSRVAAGIWNPVVFKRMTKSWMADAVIPHLSTFYGNCEERLHKKIVTHRPLIKPFTEDQEKDLWVKKSKEELTNYLDASIHSETPSALNHFQINNGYGVVHQSGNLHMAEFLDGSELFFKERIISEQFHYDQLTIFSEGVAYGDFKAKNIIFCEGHLVSKNPYFSWIPLKPAKGELLTLEIPQLQLKNAIFNKNGFLMDIARGRYKMGATYEWQDLLETPSKKGYAELTAKLDQMIHCSYSILKQEAGIRPSSIDRRPIIGKHPQHERLFVFNGMGTKGVMLAPFFANNFVNFYLQKEKLNSEVSLSRFYHLYETCKA